MPETSKDKFIGASITGWLDLAQVNFTGLTADVPFEATTGPTQGQKQLPPMALIQPSWITVKWGISNPVDGERCHLLFAEYDNVALPDRQAAIRTALWLDFQKWEHLGTAANAVNVVQGDQQVLPPVVINTTSIIRRRTPLFVGLLAFASGTEVIIQAMGKYTMQISYIQRKWGGDNTTFDSAETKKGGLMWEDYNGEI